MRCRYFGKVRWSGSCAGFRYLHLQTDLLAAYPGTFFLLSRFCRPLSFTDQDPRDKLIILWTSSDKTPLLGCPTLCPSWRGAHNLVLPK